MSKLEHFLILWCTVLTVSHVVMMLHFRKHLKARRQEPIRYIKEYLRDGGTLS